MPARADPPPVALLAGGRSRRMQGSDKALVTIGGMPMIDRLIARLRPQSATLILSAVHDYGTGLAAVADGPQGPAGPAGAIRAVAAFVAAHGGERFVTVPVDAPFVPHDLVARLAAAAETTTAMARAGGAWQPTFACWHAQAVLAALPGDRCGEKWSLLRLGTEVGARPVEFRGAHALMNVNTPAELAAAQHLAQSSAAGPPPGSAPAAASPDGRD